MRFILAVLMLAGWGMGQSITMGMAGTGTTGSLTILSDPPKFEMPDEKNNVLLVQRASELCFECPTRYAVICAAANCDVPTKTVLYYHWFATIHGALAKAETENWDVAWLAVTRPLDLDKTETEQHEKIPDKITTKHHYKLKESK